MEQLPDSPSCFEIISSCFYLLKAGTLLHKRPSCHVRVYRSPIGLMTAIRGTLPFQNIKSLYCSSTQKGMLSVFYDLQALNNTKKLKTQLNCCWASLNKKVLNTQKQVLYIVRDRFILFFYFYSLNGAWNLGNLEVEYEIQRSLVLTLIL